MPVSCSRVVICWERADLLAVLYVMFSCFFFVTFPHGVLDQVWYLIVSIPDIFSCLPYLKFNEATLLIRKTLKLLSILR